MTVTCLDGAGAVADQQERRRFETSTRASSDDSRRLRRRRSTEVSIRSPASDSEWREASALLHDFADWILAAAGVDLWVDQQGFADEVVDLRSAYGGERASMFVAFDRGLACGTVAVRFHPDGTAELKRMYVRRAARGSGLADRLVAQVIRAAADRGCTTVWLETLRGAMDPAISVYRRCGFVDAERSGTLAVDGIVVMERPIAGGPPVESA